MEFKNVVLEMIPKMSYTDLREIQDAIDISLNKDNVQEKAIAMIKEGSLLQAVKFVKECTGMGLKEAKDYVDDLRQRIINNPGDYE